MKAAIYLRVSTKDQATRGGESEGFSIPAQRDAALHKAASLGAQVVEEFVDRGVVGHLHGVQLKLHRRPLRRVRDQVRDVLLLMLHRLLLHLLIRLPFQLGED